MVKMGLLAFGFVANAASILGFWLSYASSSADSQARVGKLLSLVGAIVAAAVYLFLAWWVLRRKPANPPTVERTFSADNVLIFSNGPVLFLNQQRSHVEIQMGILSTATVELLYVEAKIYWGSTLITEIESSKPVTIPEMNPQNQIIAKSLTEKELQRFNPDPAAFFDIGGYARFRGPDGKDITKLYKFCAAAWRLPGSP
jgi:hypothetical protein